MPLTTTARRRPRAASRRKCLLFFCKKPQFTGGLCEAHYFNVLRYGTFLCKIDTVSLFGHLYYGRALIRRVINAYRSESKLDGELLFDLNQYINKTALPYSLHKYLPEKIDDQDIQSE